MAFTPTAQRLADSLPDYYEGEPLFARMLQAIANEIDRVEARALAVRAGLLPSVSTDLLGLLSMWEAVFGLPINAAATEAQRRNQIVAAIRKLDVSSALSTVLALEASSGYAIRVYENEPGPLEDVVEIPFEEGSYSAGQVQQLAERIWPAHRRIRMRYGSGFLLDKARLDAEVL